VCRRERRSCVDVCQVDCIHEAKRVLVIDPEECIDCGACEPECPVEAIFPEDALPEKWTPFVRVNYAYGEGLETVDRLIDELRPNDDGLAGLRERKGRRPVHRRMARRVTRPTEATLSTGG
jgi:NAD-dependent dihydropyrimidine dehydrogenase PreA subunit